MKKLLVLAAIIFFAGSFAHALDAIYISSTTSVALGTQALCGGSPKTKRGELFAIIVSSAGTTGSGNRVTIWNSSMTFTDARAEVDTRSLGSYQYNVAFPKGMAITKDGTATTTILYNCY